MTDLVSHQPHQIAPAKRRSGLPNLEQHAEVRRSLSVLMNSVPVRTYRARPEIGPHLGRRWAVSLARGWADEVEVYLAEMASPEVVKRYVEAARIAVDTPADHRVTKAALALLIDSKARPVNNPAVFIEASTFDLVDEGYSPVTVVCALQKLRREMVFLPEIPELLTACRAERDMLRWHLKRAEDAQAFRVIFERERAALPAFIAKAEAMPEEPERVQRFKTMPPPPKSVESVAP